MPLTNVTATKEHGHNSEVRKLRNLVNSLARVVASQMPGVLLSDPATKTGTTSAKTWRAEAFTFKFRGLTVSAAAQEKALTATTHDVAASKEAWFVLTTQADGTTFTITKAADQTIGTQVLPTAPDNEVIIAYMQIVTNATGFDATTDDLAEGTGVDDLNFYDADFVYTINATAEQQTANPV
jgi:hypothetical protein